jgi:hypothetical protein
VRVRRLVAKAFGTSKLVVNPINETDKQSRVLAVLRAYDSVTTEEITAQLTRISTHRSRAASSPSWPKKARCAGRSSR